MVVKSSEILLFADDVKWVINDEEDCLGLQNDLDAVFGWSMGNALSFNLTKCETMSFTRSPAPIEYRYQLGGEGVLRVSRVRDLGVEFDPSLTFRDHCTQVTKKGIQRLGFVLRNSQALTPSALRTLYTALVRSILETNAVVWNPNEKKYVLMLEKVQKKFLRSLYKKQFRYFPFLYPTQFLLGQLGYESLELRRSLATIKFVLGLIRHKLDSVELVGEVMRLFVPDSRSRLRAPRLLAPAGARTGLYRYSPLRHALAMLNSMLSAAPHCDLFASGLASLINECKRMLEKNECVNT